MHNITKTLLALFVFCALSLVAFPSQAFALDNHEIDDVCTVLVNGQPAGTSVDNAPRVSANSVEVGTGRWPISVTLGQAAAEHYQRCGGTLKLSAGRTNAVFEIGGWDETSLSAESPYTGLMDFSRLGTDDGDKWSFDIEIKPNSESLCENEEPICRRVYVQLDSTQVEGPALSCTDELAAFDAAIEEAFPDSIAVGQQISVTVPVSQTLLVACSVYSVQHDIVRFPTRRNVANGIRSYMTENYPIHFEPQFIGEHVLNIQLNRLVRTGFFNLNSEIVEIATFTKNFCVVGSAGETCVPNPDGTDLPDKQGPFNLCKQIPVITDGQIRAVVQEGQSGIDKLLLWRQARQRRDRLIREKRQCCECSGGTYDTTANVCNLPEVLEGMDPANQGIYTAVGCIPANSESIVAQMVKIGLGIAGGVALLMILAGSFMLSTSQGEPKRAGEAKELITSAVMGLLFIIFSVAILQFIGVTILRIPGFGSP